MNPLTLHLMASGHVPTVIAQAFGVHGIARYLVRRLLLHTLLRTGGWVLVPLVVAVLVVAAQIARRRR